MKNYFYNMLSNIKNGQLTKRNFIYNLNKKSCKSFLKILWDEGFISGYKISKKKRAQLKIFLKYKNNRPAINSLKIISKPGKQIYLSFSEICKINASRSFIIFSTQKGLKSLLDCKKLKIGGKPIISIN